jgi:hypothetical protein
MQPIDEKKESQSVPGREIQGMTDHNQSRIDELNQKIDELRKKEKNDPQNDDAPKPDANAKEKALIALAICAFCIIGAIALPGIGAQFLGVLAGVTGIFGLAKAKDAIAPTTASKVRNVKDKALEALLKELKREIDYQKGHNLGLSGAELTSGPFKDTRKQAFSTSEIAGYDAGKTKYLENKTKEVVPIATPIPLAKAHPISPESQLLEEILQKNPDKFQEISHQIKALAQELQKSPDAGGTSNKSEQSISSRPSQKTSDPDQESNDRKVVQSRPSSVDVRSASQASGQRAAGAGLRRGLGSGAGGNVGGGAGRRNGGDGRNG